jgi:hypothetical protein
MVQERATRTLSEAIRHGFRLDIALDQLTIGRAMMARYRLKVLAGPQDRPCSPQVAHLKGGADIANHIEAAVSGLRLSGALDQLPRGLLARAECRHWVGDEAGAEADLREAENLAARSRMRLYLTDLHFLRARFEASGNPARAREHLTQAKQLVSETGYHRRDRDIAVLEDRLGRDR